MNECTQHGKTVILDVNVEALKGTRGQGNYCSNADCRMWQMQCGPSFSLCKCIRIVQTHFIVRFLSPSSTLGRLPLRVS